MYRLSMCSTDYPRACLAIGRIQNRVPKERTFLMAVTTGAALTDTFTILVKGTYFSDIGDLRRTPPLYFSGHDGESAHVLMSIYERAAPLGIFTTVIQWMQSLMSVCAVAPSYWALSPY